MSDILKLPSQSVISKTTLILSALALTSCVLPGSNTVPGLPIVRCVNDGKTDTSTGFVIVPEGTVVTAASYVNSQGSSGGDLNVKNLNGDGFPTTYNPRREEYVELVTTEEVTRPQNKAYDPSQEKVIKTWELQYFGKVIGYGEMLPQENKAIKVTCNRGPRPSAITLNQVAQSFQLPYSLDSNNGNIRQCRKLF